MDLPPHRTEWSKQNNVANIFLKALSLSLPQIIQSLPQIKTVLSLKLPISPRIIGTNWKSMIIHLQRLENGKGSLEMQSARWRNVELELRSYLLLLLHLSCAEGLGRKLKTSAERTAPTGFSIFLRFTFSSLMPDFNTHSNPFNWLIYLNYI